MAEAKVETKAWATGHHSDNHAVQNRCRQYSVLTGVDGSKDNVYIVVSESELRHVTCTCQCNLALILLSSQPGTIFTI